MATQVIVIGGGLAGVSAANTVVERGGRVLLLEKNPFMGGNSTKATSGINGALTKTQMAQGIHDSAASFEADTALSAAGGQPAPASALAKVLTHQSAAAVDWLTDFFGLDLSLVSRLGGHSYPRTHRGKERFPGMTITYALMERLEDLARKGDTVRIIARARVTSLLLDGSGGVLGVEFEKDGQTFKEHGPVIVATGGFAADFSDNGILKQVRPDLLHLPTTNGEHCTGDGIKMAVAIGANTVDLDHVQVHPTGLVHPDEPDAKVKFLAAEALRGVGGLMLDAHGKRFCDELGRRDYVTGEMWKHQGPFRLVLNGKGTKEIEWHCKHYVGRGLMKRFESGAALAAEMGISSAQLEATFTEYNEISKTPSKDPFGKKYFHNVPFEMDDVFHVAIVCPVVHYCMGGLEVLPSSQVVGKSGPIAGLWAAGEVVGGIHGKNRLGGNSLLDCVVFGRLAGQEASKYLLSQAIRRPGTASHRLATIESHLQASHNGVTATVQVDPDARRIVLEFGWSNRVSDGAAPAPKDPPSVIPNDTPVVQPPASSSSSSTKQPLRKITMAEVAKHNKPDDCWVVINGHVLDVTEFRKDHPGGAKSILLYAGKDASEEFGMLHKPDVVEKYAPETIIGILA